MTLHLSIVADVFTDETKARHAIEALRQAGFAYDQIGIAMRGHEGIDLRSDLQNLGVSYEQASYYVQEVKAGHTVVSVRPDGREQEAHEIMRQSGALTDADTTASQTPDIDKQRAAWDQAVASQQTYRSAQAGTDAQEDFHRPRSLKPRTERQPVAITSVETEEDGLHPVVMIQQKPSDTPVVQHELVTEQKPSDTPVVHNELVTEQKPSDTPVVHNELVTEQSPLVAAEHHETTAIDDEETLRRLRDQGQSSKEAFPPQMPPEKHTNKKMMKTGLLVGGLLLVVSAGVLLAFLRGEQIRQFVLSTMQMMKKQRMTVTH